MEKEYIEDSNSGVKYSIRYYSTFYICIQLTNDSYVQRIQFNSEEQWTKALKFMLTNLKWALAWVSSQFVNKT